MPVCRRTFVAIVGVVTLACPLIARAQPGTDRPQHPAPPFPYSSREITVERTEKDAAGTDTHFVLAGTLTMPSEADFGPGPHPAVILITGSGAQDRDETIFRHKPFLVIADALTRRGVAVLRLDDRGVGGSSGAGSHVTTTHFAADIAEAARALAQQPGIDAKRIGLVGHSEGGTVAPMVAAEHPDRIAFIALLAGTGVPGCDLMAAQFRAVYTSAGASPDFVDRASAAHQAIQAAFADPAVPAEARRAAVRRLAMMQMNLDPDKPAPAQAEKAIAAAERAGTAQFESAWMREFLSVDPAPIVARVRCPVLIMNGGKDTQVLAAQNVPPLVGALLHAGNTEITVRILPRCNHLFQECETGSPDEYGRIEQTFAPEALECLAGWVAWASGK